MAARSRSALPSRAGSSGPIASGPRARTASPSLSSTGVPMRGPYSRRSMNQASGSAGRRAISFSSIHLKSKPSRSRLPTRSWMRLFFRWSGWPGLGIGSRFSTSPRKTPPSLNVTSSRGRGQKKPSPFTRITPTRPAIMRRHTPRALPVNQIRGSPRRRLRRRGFIVDPPPYPSPRRGRGTRLHVRLRLSSNRPITLAQALADHLRNGVDEEGHEKQDPRRHEQHAIEGASVGSLWDLHRDVGGEGAHAIEDGPVEDRRIAGGHEHDH